MRKGAKLTAKQVVDKSLKDSAYRRELFAKLCQHIKAGYSIDCFSELDNVTILRYLKEFPEEFVQSELDCALRDGKLGWETIGRRQADGSCLGNSRSWQYNMANRYGWRDKQDVANEHKGDVKVSIVSYTGASKPS